MDPRGEGAHRRSLDARRPVRALAATVHYSDPDSVIQPATTKAHGWREVMVEDPDGYLWAVGVPTSPKPGS